MKKYYKIFYLSRLLLYVLHLFTLFFFLNKILKVKIFGTIFLILEIILVINTLLEMLSKKERYKRDLSYNIMNIGYLIYYYIFIFRVYKYNINYLVGLKYMIANFIILSILIIFLIVFSRIILKDYNKK